MTTNAIYTLTGYFAVFALSVAFAYIYQNSHKQGEINNRVTNILFRCVVILPPAMLIGFRGIDVGWDTSSMIYQYWLNDRPLEYLLSNVHDPLFVVLFMVVRSITMGNITAGLFVVSFMTLFILESALIKWGGNISLPFGLFVYYMYFACIGMDQMKQMLALSIVLYGVACLVKGERKMFLFFTTIAGLLHFTAFVAYMFYFFYIKGSKHSVIVATVLIFLVIITVFSDFLFAWLKTVFGQGSYANYFTGRYAMQAAQARGDRTGLRFVLDMIPCIFPLVFWRSIPEKYRTLFVLTLATAMPLRMLGYQSDFLYRVYYEPAAMIVFAYPLVATSLDKKKKSFIIVSCVVLIAYYYLAYSTSHGVIPYSLSLV